MYDYFIHIVLMVGQQKYVYDHNKYIQYIIKCMIVSYTTDMLY